MKTLRKGDIIRVKTPIEGYYSGYGITPKFYLTPNIEATVIDPKVPCVWVRKNGPDTFICVKFLSPITNNVEWAAIFGINNIIKVE